MHSEPITYKIVFESCSRAVEEQNDFARVLHQQIKEDNLSQVYTKIFYAVTLCIVADGFSKKSSRCAPAAEDVDRHLHIHCKISLCSM